MRRIDSCGHKAWTSSDPAEFKGRSKASNFGELRDGLISGKFWERRRWQPVEAPPGNIMSGGEPRCSARFAGAHSPGGSRSIATASSMCSGPSVPSMVGTSEADYARTQRQSRAFWQPKRGSQERLSPDCLHRRRHRLWKRVGMLPRQANGARFGSFWPDPALFGSGLPGPGLPPAGIGPCWSRTYRPTQERPFRRENERCSHLKDGCTAHDPCA